ncbi:uncharacterized protein LOC115663484 [Syzygium oleosum]|uniref:uncharacterized protein LOC115663487 n=1 Tax=Syzygium oleosum TaxID=219896 RepID=UPI0011D1EDAE|nr:uncharacterized protein LOC115663487 [Syzygium oleosum]XP_056175276.1 uncharacterized protein LOC115663484 [Syzygium oleosum]
MEVATLDVEDDVYFADLSKQISLLIMDEDEHLSVTQQHSAPLQGFSRLEINSSSTPSPSLHEQVCARESKGTGVFIPKCSQPRRRSRHGRSSSSFNNSARSYRQIDSTKRVSQAPQANSFNPKTKS